MPNESVNGYGLDTVPMTVVSLRMPVAEKGALEEKAKAAGASLSEWARDTLLHVPTFDPKRETLQEAALEEILQQHVTEQAVQYKHFLSAAETLFNPLAQQMSNHREWMKGTLTAFSRDLAQQVTKVTEAIDLQDQQTAARLKESDRRFYARWIYVCLAAFLVAAVSGFAFGYWRP